eukprot:NODE_2542_length_345_cov_127.532110_g2532_i0.p1 GENE.NODE_2542_length_345_cov_127.532110_g2532_i0~~NODE_2542_length_345_cov_127.532110_g2532_i0.p1  ORF type:complete len:67 (-),score=19.90 NODE_2542_length_345_cov_127.532110_g2532_i0:143-313(-)
MQSYCLRHLPCLFTLLLVCSMMKTFRRWHCTCKQRLQPPEQQALCAVQETTSLICQ